MSFFDMFVDPPTDLVAEQTWIPMVVTPLILVASLIFGVIYTRRTRSPLYIWAAVGGFVFYPFLVEPFGDWFINMWYPTNQAIMVTIFDRPIPWFALFFYGGAVPAISVAVYEIAKRGLPAKRMLQLLLIVAILELPNEILGGHFQFMEYYANHALILEVPIYCYVQNAGWFAVIAWVLVCLLPHIRGWRWILVPIALGLTLPVYALVATFPAYIAMANDAGPVLGWTAGIISTILNAAVAVACIYSPQLRRLREAAQDKASTLDTQLA